MRSLGSAWLPRRPVGREQSQCAVRDPSAANASTDESIQNSGHERADLKVGARTRELPPTFRNRIRHSTSSKKMASPEFTIDGDDSNLIDPKDLTWNENDKLGAGSFGVVYKGTYMGKDVAVKVIEKASVDRDMTRNHEYLYSVLATHRRQIQRFAQLRHPCILPYWGISRKSNTDVPVIVTDYARGGSLMDGLSNVAFARARLGEKTILNILTDIAIGLAYLHSKKCTHGDLNPTNILVSEKFEIADNVAVLRGDARVMLAGLGYSLRFGCSTESRNEYIDVSEGEEVRCTRIYRAPETFDNTWTLESLAAVDIYAFGVIIYELVMLKYPWEGELYGTTVEEAVLSGRRPDWGYTKVPAGFKKLAADCWQHDPSKRPTSKQLVKILQEFNVPHPPGKSRTRSTSSRDRGNVSTLRDSMVRGRNTLTSTL